MQIGVEARREDTVDMKRSGHSRSIVIGLLSKANGLNFDRTCVLRSLFSRRLDMSLTQTVWSSSTLPPLVRDA
jgi:hypothetical protein